MFEHFGDFARAAEATQRFRQHYGIEYITLIAGISDKDEAAKKLPMLQRFYAFPTTVSSTARASCARSTPDFLVRHRRSLHQFVREVKATLDQLLAES